MDFQESTKVAVKPAVIYYFSDRFQIPLELRNLQFLVLKGRCRPGSGCTLPYRDLEVIPVPLHWAHRFRLLSFPQPPIFLFLRGEGENTNLKNPRKICLGKLQEIEYLEFKLAFLRGNLGTNIY